MASDLIASEAIEIATLYVGDELLPHATVYRQADSIPIHRITDQDTTVRDSDLDALAAVTPLGCAPCLLVC
jgi:hypothetical protein